MSDNVKVYEIAEEAGASSSEVITKAKDLGIELNPEYIKIAQKRINSTERNGLIIFKEESE